MRPPADVIADRAHPTSRLGAPLSAFGAVAGAVLLVAAARERRSGASAPGLAAAGVVFLGALSAWVRDVRRLRRERTA
ncbi:hypothetical protein U5640_38875 [Streptomyces sp. SS7]|uniref:hypothetical protein n=1 Tax=Streptomyces sp. SS7 TaxID=3108485 RepID=UPI0030EC8984